MALGFVLPFLIAATRVVVIPIVGADDRAGMERVVAAVGGAVELHADVEVVKIDDLYTPDGATLIAAVPRCGADVECVRRALETFGAGLGIVVVLNRRIDPIIIQVEIVPGTESVKVVRTSPTSLGPTETQDQALHRLTMEVLRGAGFQRAARIFVNPNPADATVALNGTVQPRRGPQVYQVAPGAYRVDITRDGYLAIEHQRVLAGGDRWDVDAQLVAKIEDVSVLSSPWFWVGTVGAIVAAGVVTGVAISQSGPKTVCIVAPGNTDPCPCQ